MSHPFGTDYDPPAPRPPLSDRARLVLSLAGVVVAGVVILFICFMCGALHLLPGQAGCP